MTTQFHGFHTLLPLVVLYPMSVNPASHSAPVASAKLLYTTSGTTPIPDFGVVQSDEAFAADDVVVGTVVAVVVVTVDDDAAGDSAVAGTVEYTVTTDVDVWVVVFVATFAGPPHPAKPKGTTSPSAIAPDATPNVFIKPPRRAVHHLCNTCILDHAVMQRPDWVATSAAAPSDQHRQFDQLR